MVSLSLLVVGLVALCAVHVHAQSWTSYDNAFDLHCLAYRVIKRVQSKHDNSKEDRSWYMDCLHPPGDTTLEMDDCHWTDYVNHMDGVMDFNCPQNQVISGFGSYHENYYEDRRFNFECCPIRDHATVDCEMTDYVNSFDGPMDYTVPDDKVMVGWYSYHDGYYEDRRFKFNICSLSRH